MVNWKESEKYESGLQTWSVSGTVEPMDDVLIHTFGTTTHGWTVDTGDGQVPFFMTLESAKEFVLNIAQSRLDRRLASEEAQRMREARLEAAKARKAANRKKKKV